MIKINRKEECCGCNVCGDICPKDAISFPVDEEGFWYPKINLSKCVNCGLCEKVCPTIHSVELKKNDKVKPDCYAAVHKNIEVVFSSTTGGLFSALADVTYRRQGYVGGAIHNSDFSVSHFLSNNKEDLARLRRSKDLQSNAEGFYRKIRDCLDQGENVLVCGVPCQMAGLRLFLGKDYPNLIIVDLICLGVNSPKVWQKYIASIQEKYGSEIIWTENKSKEYGWRSLAQKFVFADGQEVFDTKDTSPFIKGYVGTHLYCRPSCYECRFKGFPRIADISIGDFWGIERFDKSVDNDLGTSLVMINSKKGEEYFQSVKKRIKFKHTPLEWALPGNPALQYSVSKIISKRKEFFEDLDLLPFEDVVEKYSKTQKVTWKHKVRHFIRLCWNHIRFVKKIVVITRLSPKSLYQTIRYSGLRNLWNHHGIICGTHCILNISKISKLQFDGLLIFGLKGRFPTSSLESRLLVSDNAKLTVLGDMTIGYGSDIEVFDNAELIFHGKKFGVNDTNIGCTIICGERIEIMSDVAMGRNVLIRDTNGKHYMTSPGYRPSKPVIIGEKTWLCESCTIMPGVKTGYSAIVGANAMVTSSVPAHAMVSGCPATVVNNNVLWKC